MTHTVFIIVNGDICEYC